MICRIFACALLAAALSACTPEMLPHDMAPDAEIVKQIDHNPALTRKILLHEVSVNEYAEHNGVVTIKPATFRSALNSALRDAHFNAHEETITTEANAVYNLDARLTEFDSPGLGWGFSFDIPSAVDYTLTRRADGAIIYHETIRQIGHTGFADAPDAHQRVRLAMERSLSENITHLLRVLGQLEITPGGKRASPAPAAPSAPAAPNSVSVAVPAKTTGWGRTQ